MTSTASAEDDEGNGKLYDDTDGQEFNWSILIIDGRALEKSDVVDAAEGGGRLT